MTKKKFHFATAVLDWFDQHGRKDLPWQQDKTPYRVWVSEIMLQQTQVATVIPYYERFMNSFPDVFALAEADTEEVLAHWAGLGYYARARNLQACARAIVDRHDGEFPMTVEALADLPGIGPSTAGAVISLSSGKRAVILDGNVKRVLTRFGAIPGVVTQPATDRALWSLADELTPSKRVDDYNQAMMDLGATVCTRSKPVCLLCPLQQECKGRQEGDPTAYPHRKAGKSIPLKERAALVLVNESGEVWLERRPPTGIWGGLYSLPEIDSAEEQVWREQLREKWSWRGRKLDVLPAVEHVFSHYRLHLTPLRFDNHILPRVAEGEGLWYNAAQRGKVGLPAPIQRFLDELLLTAGE